MDDGIGATKHITGDQIIYVEFQWILVQSKNTCLGNNSSVKVVAIGTCKLILYGGQTFLLPNVLFAPDV